MIKQYEGKSLLITYIFKPIYYKEKLKIFLTGLRDKKQARVLEEVLKLNVGQNILKYAILINGEEIKDKAT